ncbi:MAG: EAL domain-containing protein [Sterolibacterium sp.]|nr:EAL domain-containing protein [Sterolibacterium sp.]
MKAPSSPPSFWREPLRVAGFGLLYAALGWLMLTYLTAPGFLSLFWPNAGLALAVLLRGGRHYWPGVFFGVFGVFLGTHHPFLMVLIIALGTTLGALTAHAWLTRQVGFSDEMKSSQDFRRLLEAAALGAFVKALIGTVALLIGGMTALAAVPVHAMQWWQTEFLGMMLGAPLFLFWHRGPGSQELRSGRGVESVLCLIMAFMAGEIIFLGVEHDIFGWLGHAYWMFLFVTWAAIRLGRHALSLLLMMVALQGIMGAVHGVGYFSDDFARTGLNNYWCFTMVLGSVGYALLFLMAASRNSARQMQREMKFAEDIVASLPGAFFMLDSAARLVRWNEQLQAATGYSEEELQGKPVLELVREADRPLLAGQIAQALQDGEGRAEAFMRDKKGASWPCQFNGRRTELDGQTYIVGMGESVYERKQAEAALRESETRYRQLFENINASVTIFDLSFTIVMVNECNARMLKRTPDQMVGETIHTLYPERAAFFEQRYREIIATRQGGIFEDEFPLLDGLHCFSSYVHPMCDVTGTPIGLQVIAFDISDRKNAERALRQSEELLSLALESTGDDVWDWNIENNHIQHTERWTQIMGYPASKDLPCWEGIVHPDDAQRAQVCRQQLFDSAFGKTTFELRLKNSQGEWKWLLGHGLVVRRDENGRALRAVGTLADITTRKLMEEELRKSEQMWRFALEGSGDAVWDWNVKTNEIVSSPNYRVSLGYAPDDDEWDDWASRVHPDDRELAWENTSALQEGRIAQSCIELRVRCKDGSYKYMQSRSMVVDRDEQGQVLRVVGTTTDITHIKEHQQQLERIAHFDALTGLPNRLMLANRLQQALAQSQRRGQWLAVVYLDLDGFKAVNDHHGHNVGDELLVTVSQRMKVALREGDTLARIGGDEFIAVLVDFTQPGDCKPVLDRLLEAAAQPVEVHQLTLHVSASLGVSLFPGDGGDADELIRHADQAMYQAKASGKNRYHMFDAEQDAAVRLKHESLANISRGLKRGEFVLYYQPKVNMRSGALIGAEALIRWQHPEHGLMSPAHFLPVIAGQSVDIELGEWVIDTALRQMELWRAEGLVVAVSVNISTYHLQQENFVTRLSELMAAHPEIEPYQLELEILESGAFDDITRVSAVIRACQAMGMRFALDDFGTGYSSLSYLKRLSASVLKIDQSFVRDILDDPDDLTLVDGIVSLAQSFHREVIAEGVESLAHGELLLRLGCEQAQGYGIAMPMAAAQLPGWVAHWHKNGIWQRWQGVVTNKNSRVPLFAEVRHRQWVRDIERLLAGDEVLRLPEHGGHCQLSIWLDEAGAGAGQSGNGVDYSRATAVHERLHALGNALMAAHAAGRIAEAREQQTELLGLHDELVGLLRRMTQHPAA